MILLKTYIINYISANKPARAFNSTLTRGAKPEVFRGATEGIEEARTRQNNLPEEIARVMSNIKARFNPLTSANPNETLKKINKVRRLIGQSIPAQLEYAKELQELAGYKAKLALKN